MKVLSSRRLRLASQLLFLVAGVALSAGLIIVLIRSVNVGRLGSDFRHANYLFLVATIPTFAANVLFKVPRWGILFGDDAPGWDTMFGAINVGYAVNTLLPARLGDFVRAYWIRDHAGIGIVRTLSTIALERVTDGIAVLALFLILAPTVAFPAGVRSSALLAGVLFVAVLLVMVALVYSMSRDNAVARLVQRHEEGRWGMAGRAIRQLTNGLRALNSIRAILLLILYTMIIWGSNALLLWFILRAFHLDAPYAAGLLSNSVVSLGMTVPSTPGYIGIFDYLIVITLGLYGIGKTSALAAALVFHAIAFIPVTIIGIIYIARAGLRVTTQMLRSGAERSVESVEP